MHFEYAHTQIHDDYTDLIDTKLLKSS